MISNLFYTILEFYLSKVNLCIIFISTFVLIYEEEVCKILWIVLGLLFFTIFLRLLFVDIYSSISNTLNFFINCPLFIAFFIVNFNMYCYEFEKCDELINKIMYLIIMCVVYIEILIILIYIFANLNFEKPIENVNLLKEIVYINTHEEVECGICLETLKNGVLVKKTPCGHVFDSKCIDEWVNVTKPLSKCPHCRTPLFEDNLIDNITLSITST